MTDVKRARCPICGAPAEPASRPFCSARCADVDLGRWLTKAYAIPVPADERPDDDDDGASSPGQDWRG